MGVVILNGVQTSWTISGKKRERVQDRETSLSKGEDEVAKEEILEGVVVVVLSLFGFGSWKASPDF